ncbi:MAG: hypothetical protein GXP43_02760 [bacterium]|nr:hypothetical protein [bacterium]
MKPNPKAWLMPPKIKVYEALGCLADGRVEVVDDKTAKVWSSNKNKFYTVLYDGDRAIVANDNGSYWQRYLGYPAIAFLIKIGKIKHDEEVSRWLKAVNWQDINQKFRRDYEKTIEFVLKEVEKRGGSAEKLKKQVDDISRQIKQLKPVYYKTRLRPPKTIKDSQLIFDSVYPK